MPKKIDIDKEKIINVTKEMIEQKQYKDINCRTIASKMEIGVGTLYNYFDSKSTILAFIMLEDWMNFLKHANVSTSLEKGLENVYQSVLKFCEKYYELWEYEKNTSFEFISLMSRHSKVISQVSDVLKKLFDFNNRNVDIEELNFLSNNIVFYASKLYDYQKLEKIFIKIIGGRDNG